MLIVQKFGGSSVADAAKIRRVAGIIADTYTSDNDVVVVLSAQGDTTDDLIKKAREINPRPSKREMDVLLSTGEQQSVALMAMALEAMGLPVVSLTGWQVGLETNAAYGSARILRVSTERIRTELDKRRIVIVAGFQGTDRNEDITTLGRGGSDTTAVAIAAVLHADKCQIFTDVDGVYTADPNTHPEAELIRDITYDECARRDLKALDADAFILLRDNRFPLVRLFAMHPEENIIKVLGGDPMGTVLHP